MIGSVTKSENWMIKFANELHNQHHHEHGIASHRTARTLKDVVFLANYGAGLVFAV